MTASRPSTRGMIIVAVLFVVVIATLVGYAGMYAAEAGLDTARASISAAQSRALAWSGVQAVMAELGEQRGAGIEGRDPTVTGAWELFKGQGGGRMIGRVLPQGGQGDKGEKLQSESAKLDLNPATAEMLAKLPGMTDDLAKAVVAARAERPFLSVADLDRVKGMAAPARDPDAESTGTMGAL